MTGRQLDLAEPLIGLDILRSELNGPNRILQCLLVFLEIFGVNMSQLQIGSGLLRLRFDRVFQNVDRRRIIAIACEEKGDTRGELDLAWIEIENFLKRFQRLFTLAILLEVQTFDILGEGFGFALALRLQRQIFRRS